MGEHILLRICVSQEGGHISQGICVSHVAEHLSLELCVYQVGEHISLAYRDMCFPRWVWGGTHLARDMCFKGKETHVTRDMG